MNRFNKNEIEILLEENGFISLSNLVYANRVSFYKSDY